MAWQSPDRRTRASLRERGHMRGRPTRKRVAVLCAALLIPASGALGCGAVEDQVRDRANEEVTRQQQNAEDRINQEITRAEDRIRQEATRALEGQ